MPAPYFNPSMSLLEMREDLVYARAACELDERAKTHAPVFEKLLAQWSEVFRAQVALWDAQTVADLTVSRADDRLDDRVDQIDRALLAHTDGDRDHPKYEQYLSVRPSQLKRPVLGEELEVLRSWVAMLEAEELPALRKLAGPLKSDVERADEAVGASKKADLENQRFRSEGGLAGFVAAAVAERDAVHGALDAYRAAHRDEKLPRDWAAGFFRPGNHGTSEKDRAARAAEREAERQAQIELAEARKLAREKLRTAQRELAALMKK